MNSIGQGVRSRRGFLHFRNSFCTNVLCAPARAVALIGMYSHATGALDNDSKNAFPPCIPLFTDLLHQAGYEVALCGEAHICNGARERYLDYYFGYNAPFAIISSADV